MANRALFISLVSMFLAVFLSASPAQLADSQPCAVPEGTPFSKAASIKIECSSTRPLQGGAKKREFVVKLPSLSQQPQQKYPWQAIDPLKDPSAYVKALLDYGIKDNQNIDWRIEDDPSNGWCHAPWFQDVRERLRGMTAERHSRSNELHALQGEGRQNWAIGFYNSAACRRLAEVWQDPAFPKTKSFAFPDGSYAIKVLFTQATPSEVPYLAGSLEWDAAIGDAGEVATLRLLQVDVAVKDSRIPGGAGWFFGTFMYDAGTPGNTPFERLVPVGLTWGNDPTLTAFQYEQQGKTVAEAWVNAAVAEKFFPLPRHNLGLFGRLNGPVDNPRSSCIACHGQALDWGRAVPKGSLAERNAQMLLPGPPSNTSDDEALGRYFMNLGTSSSVQGTQPLDYSLQVAKGIEKFRVWVRAKYPSMVNLTTDVPKFAFPTDPFEAQPATTPEPSVKIFAR
ncbi:hypothetical protein [Mesorhizobium sp. M0159]|uniref:hypothetical protein n=1 Tax=Mesorhizobium sp. M0159 TaxID=2956900 RepID=UPI00333AC36E